MKNLLYITLVTVLVAFNAQAQSALVGWDFSDLGASGLGTSVSGFAAEKTYTNNGFQTSGSISDAASAVFSANGSQASGLAATYGFDSTISGQIGGSETGQQSINFFSFPSVGSTVMTLNFTQASGVNLYLDHAGISNTVGEWLEFEVQTAGSSSFSALSSGDSILGSDNWVSTESSGAYAADGGRSNGIIDFTSEGEITAIRLIAQDNGLFGGTAGAAGSRVGIDNILITGTAVVPEPSTYALIIGFIAFLFVAIKRRS
tara:strand:- start:172 stop:951 length:780 start_codon:yes stop_codon:yes gene_type:complete